MSVSREQSMANARTASAVIARSLGFYENSGSGFKVGSLSPENQIRLHDGLMAYVVAHPNLFDANALAVATNATARPDYGRPLLNPEWTLEQFADAMLAEAAQLIPQIGNKLLWAAVIVAVAYFAGPALIRAFRAAPKPAAA